MVLGSKQTLIQNNCLCSINLDYCLGLFINGTSTLLIFIIKHNEKNKLLPAQISEEKSLGRTTIVSEFSKFSKEYLNETSLHMLNKMRAIENNITMTGIKTDI